VLRIGIFILAILAALIALFVTRADVSVTSSVDPDVMIECTSAAGADDGACLAWGDAILADGSPSTTFEAGDLVRLRLDRALFGLGAECRAEWFLGRYPDEAVWTEDVACPDG
jgi:hypothetical protein